jgi:hypothetical protein
MLIIKELLVEAAGVELEPDVENTQVVDFKRG